MKNFTIPVTYRSKLISGIKNKRKAADKMKKDFSPTLLDMGRLQIFLARHFGFCYGVENAIEIAFKTIEENEGKRIFLLSEMIHNPHVNRDLLARGVRFLQDTKGHLLIPFDELTEDDIVLIPAFGTTLHIEEELKRKNIAIEKYNTTCPFVEKVWNRSEQIAKKNYTVVIHGKPTHEETRATFSHASYNGPSIVINDMAEAQLLAAYISGNLSDKDFEERFAGRYSNGFDKHRDLNSIGVVNQTTMLASDTQSIADHLRNIMIKVYGEEAIHEHFADTRDTLCYATNDNQSAVYGLLDTEAHLAIVVGGYNSSNTSHLVELCEEKLSTYFINDASKLESPDIIHHYNLHSHAEQVSRNYLPDVRPAKILITSGASCPDALVEEVIRKLASFYDAEAELEQLINNLSN